VNRVHVRFSAVVDRVLWVLWPTELTLSVRYFHVPSQTQRLLTVHYSRNGTYLGGEYAVNDTYANEPIDKATAEMILKESVDQHQLAIALESFAASVEKWSDLAVLGRSAEEHARQAAEKAGGH